MIRYSVVIPILSAGVLIGAMWTPGRIGAQTADGQGRPAGGPLSCPSALSAESFAAVFALIKPHADESAWARIPWLTNLHEARRKAVKEDRPLLVWRAGGGDVLGRA